jgi:hypothetical protein
MIDVKQAVLIAKKQAAAMLASGNTTLEEIEKDEYKGRTVWSITLGLRWKASQLATIRRLPRESLFSWPLPVQAVPHRCRDGRTRRDEASRAD